MRHYTISRRYEKTAVYLRVLVCSLYILAQVCYPQFLIGRFLLHPYSLHEGRDLQKGGFNNGPYADARDAAIQWRMKHSGRTSVKKFC